MIWSSTCSRTVRLMIGTATSTRQSKLRGIQSAEATYTVAWGEGSSWPLPKQKIRECSRKRPTMLLTWMLSDSPGTPGLRQHMPRTTSSIDTPACDAR